MYKLTNVTTAQQYRNSTESAGTTVSVLARYGSAPYRWKVSDRYGNVWIVEFTNSVGEFHVTGIVNGKATFALHLYMSGNSVEIASVYTGGRCYTADRYLRKYGKLAAMVNSIFFLYGYRKEVTA